jgi:hypothetical protein
LARNARSGAVTNDDNGIYEVLGSSLTRIDSFVYRIIGDLSLPDAYRLIGTIQEEIGVTIGIRIHPTGAATDFLDEIRASGVNVKLGLT